MINKRDPTDAFCNETQKQIDLAIDQMLLMGMSLTPKAHGMLCHIVDQMRMIQGGVAHNLPPCD